MRAPCRPRTRSSRPWMPSPSCRGLMACLRDRPALLLGPLLPALAARRLRLEADALARARDPERGRRRRADDRGPERDPRAAGRARAPEAEIEVAASAAAARSAMARVLLVGCGGAAGRCAHLVAAGHAVRGTTRDAGPRRGDPRGRGASPTSATRTASATLMDALTGVTVARLADGHGVRRPERVFALHDGRLRMLWEKLVDTPVRGVVYEAAGTVRGGADPRRGGRPRRHDRWRSRWPTVPCRPRRTRRPGSPTPPRGQRAAGALGAARPDERRVTLGAADSSTRGVRPWREASAAGGECARRSPSPGPCRLARRRADSVTVARWWRSATSILGRRRTGFAQAPSACASGTIDTRGARGLVSGRRRTALAEARARATPASRTAASHSTRLQRRSGRLRRRAADRTALART